MQKNLKVLQALAKNVGVEAQTADIAPLGYEPADACLCGGIRRGILHEVFAACAGEEAAASGFALALAQRTLTAHKSLFWVRQDFSSLENGEICATGLLELGIDPSRILILRAPDATAALRAGIEGLGCKSLAAVIVELWGDSKTFNLVSSRRLTLAAQHHGVTAIVLRFGAEPDPSAAETRWLVRSAVWPPDKEEWGMPLFDAALVRNRHGQNGRWIMEWDCNDGIFQAHSGALATASLHRPAETALEIIRQAG